MLNDVIQEPPRACPAGLLVLVEHVPLAPRKLQDAAVAAVRAGVYSRISGSLETDLCEKLFRRISS